MKYKTANFYRKTWFLKYGFWAKYYSQVENNYMGGLEIYPWFWENINYSGYGTEKSNYELNNKYYFYYKN